MIKKIRRLWRRSPMLAGLYLVRKVTRRPNKVLISVSDWNKNWLGEEMRPFIDLKTQEQN